MQVGGSNEEYEFLLNDWKTHAKTLLRHHNPLDLGSAFARLVWCNLKQPRLASVYCKVVKEPGALVLTEPGEDLKAASIAQAEPLCTVSACPQPVLMTAGLPDFMRWNEVAGHLDMESARVLQSFCDWVEGKIEEHAEAGPLSAHTRKSRSW